MRFTPRTNTIILWIVSIGLMVGMIITFTPTLGALGGGGQNEGAPALYVNGEAITETDVARARQSPVFSAVREGPVAEDLELLLVDSLVRQEVLRQAAESQRVGGGEVRQAVQDFRERNDVAGRGNDEAYRRLIGGAGFTDSTFRDYMREQLQIESYREEITEGVEVSDAEVEAYYLANQDAYRTERRIVGRQIVVDDPEFAEELRRRAIEGESFAELAREHSLERADQGGAIGGEEPAPVGRPALPTAVADAAFALPGSGVTEVVESAGRYWIVSVEEVIPSEPRPLDEVRDQVREDALAAKRDAEVERRIEELRAEAEVTIAEESDLSFDDSVVARVGDEEILASDLARVTYTNPQIQQTLRPDTAPLIQELFKPNILEQLIDRKLAAQGAEELDAEFFGTDSLVAQSALAYVARDAEADAEAVQAYYESNLGRFTVPASADVLRADFGDAEQAQAYRDRLLEGADPSAAAEELGVELDDLGHVRAGDLAQTLDRALFATEAFEGLPDSELVVSDVLVIEEPAEEDADAAGEEPQEASAAEDEGEGAGEPAEGEEPQPEEEAATTREVHVVLVANRTPERVRPLEEVRPTVEQAVLAQQRRELQNEWLAELRERFEVENRLAELQPEPEPEGVELDGVEGVPGVEGLGEEDGAGLEPEGGLDGDGGASGEGAPLD